VVEDRYICAAALGRLDRLRKPRGRDEYHNGDFILAAILPPRSTGLGIEVYHDGNMPCLVSCNGQVQGQGGFA
jgi:hypothetical protein